MTYSSSRIKAWSPSVLKPFSSFSSPLPVKTGPVFFESGIVSDHYLSSWTPPAQTKTFLDFAAGPTLVLALKNESE